MRRRLVFAALAVAGCSALTNLDDLRDDASTDTNTPDTLAPDTSLPDGGTTFCSPYADAALAYCESFDLTNPLELTTSGGADAGVDDADSVSPPSSLLVTIPVSDAGLISACLSHQTSIAASTVTVDFDFKMASSTYEPSGIALIRAQASTGTRALIFILTVGGFFIQETVPGSDGGATAINHPSITYVWDQQWHAIHIAIDYIGKTDSVAIDNTNYEANYALAPAWLKGDVEFQLGLAYMGSSMNAWMLRLDNVLLQLAL